ncbi:MAG: RsmD family RNA methyltransferase [Chloroflexi bacterium]|nr:RsmD family RNA methyltransferase [Chloroflexota bacterium]
MRVISGTAKGRTLKSPGAATRPITDRVKENLFNIVGARVREANVLDLFAGAGSVGIEALSRGARFATFVENDRDALSALRANLELTRLDARARIVRDDVFRFIRRHNVIASEAQQSPSSNLEVASSQKALLAMTVFDLIYIAPPQYKELWSETLQALDGRGMLATSGIIVAQIFPKEYRALELKEFALQDQRTYGSTMLCFYRGK